ncbi:NlpC/P60 family protein [Burkholderia anthina]|uniref:NlpC/P60 family protein n=1 Tax=Burkholderia anthina TaxID=179879 RepID=UPI00158BD0A7|nr:NlpC/P60 family protein [Burkholderia anthina]
MNDRIVTREQFVAEARTWMDTPFKMQGRLKGVGVDCAGLIIETARVLGLTEFDYTTYRRPKGDMMRDFADDLMDPIRSDQTDAADVMLFRWGNHTTHIALLTGPRSVIHAHAPNRRVVEHDLSDDMLRYLERAYHIRGIV